MRKTNNNFAMMALAAALLLLLGGCDRRPLEVFYPETVAIRLNVAWYEGSPFDSQLKAEGKPLSNFGEKPNGMTVRLAKDGTVITQTSITNDVEQYRMNLEPGTYYVNIFNNTTSEFSNTTFTDMDSYIDAAAHVGTVVRSSRSWDENVSYLKSAEKLGVANDTIVITEEMLKEQLSFTNYKNRNNLPEVPEEKLYDYYESVQKMVSTLTVRVKVKGICNMSSVAGYLTGMADGFYLSEIWRTYEEGAVWLSGWSVEQNDCEGYINITVNTMGLPHGKEFIADRDSTDNVLVLHFTLNDGSTLDFTYNVGKTIHYVGLDENDPSTLSPADVALDLELILDAPLWKEDTPDKVLPVLPDVEKKEEGSGTKAGGFDAEVAPWEDGGTVDIGL